MDVINEIFGLHAERLSFYQMGSRALIVFFAALAFVRFAGLRIMGKQTAFDYLTALMLGAILGRAIVTADQPFFESLGVVFILVLLHRLVASLSYHSQAMGRILKGKPVVVLLENGNYNRPNMKKARITEDDIKEAARESINTDNMAEIKLACLERNGEISIVKAGH